MKLLEARPSKRFGVNKYGMGLFLCQCGAKVVRIKRFGITAQFCTPKCYVRHRGKRGAYNSDKKVINKKYIYIYCPEHPNAVGGRKLYVAEHRLRMEEKIGRLLTKDEIVHHINEDTMDNRIENLQIMTPSEHGKHHQNFRKHGK